MTAIAILGSGAAVAAIRPHGVACKLTAAAPTEANDHITGNGSIRCKTSRTVHVHIETQTLQQGQWGTLGSFDDPYLQVQAAKTHHVSTGPTNCRGLGNVTIRTVLRLVSRRNFRRVLASVHSRNVQISCSRH